MTIAGTCPALQSFGMDIAPLILVVDDDPRGIAALEGLLRPEGYRIECAASGAEALDKAARLQPDVVLLDVMMPDMDGFDVCRAIRSTPALAEMPIILVTALDDRDAILQGLDAGADELVTKPFNRLIMKTRLRTLTRVNRYRRLVDDRALLQATSEGVISVLTDLLTVVDPVNFGRAQAVRNRVRALADQLQLGDTWTIELAAMLSRIGYLTIPARVQEKERGSESLTPAELTLLARVPEIGRNLLARVPQLHDVAEIVRWQHARYDGGENGEHDLRGESLPLGARLLKVAHDAVELELHGIAPIAAWQTLAGRPGWYDPQALAAAEFVAKGQAPKRASSETAVREAQLHELQPGWRLHQDLIAVDGTLLLGAGHEITPALLEAIRNFSAIAEITNGVVVEIPASDAA